MRFGSLTTTVCLSLALFVAGGSLSGTNPDGDGIFDLVDNCSEGSNPAPGFANTSDMQTDTDRDGFGNRCDADFNNNGFVNAQDFSLFIQCFGLVPGNIATTFTSDGISCLNMDNNENLFVNVQDFATFLVLFQPPPNGTLGPSGLACAKGDAGSPNLTGRHPCEFDPTPND